MFTLQNLDKILLHIDIDVAIECAAAFDVTGEGRDEVGHSCLLKDDFDVIVVYL